MLKSTSNIVTFCATIAAVAMISVVPVGAAEAAPAAAAVEIKACYQTVIKKCCDVAKDVELTVECSEGDYSWVCIGKVHKNPLVDSTTRSTEGLRFSTTVGTADCEYQKPECGSSIGSCRFAADSTIASCDIKRATGATCVSPQLLNEDSGLGLNVSTSSCYE